MACSTLMAAVSNTSCTRLVALLTQPLTKPLTQKKTVSIKKARAAYKSAVMDMLNSSKEVMERNNLKIEDVKWFVPHQANLRIIEAVGSRLGLSEEQVLVNIQKVGNTSAASIRICL